MLRLPVIHLAQRGIAWPSRRWPSALLLAALMIGSPAQAQNSAPSPEEAQALAPREPEDEDVAERLRTIFAVVEELTKIQVSVRSGVVRLSGTVLSEADRKRAGELAAGLDGVVYVDNDLEVAADVSERVNPVIAQLEKQVAAIVAKLPLIGLALVVFFPFALLAKLLGAWKAPFRLVTRTPLVRGIVQRVVATLVVIVGIVLALQVLDAAALVGAVLGTAGVLGVALGFAFRDIVENYLASILLGIRRPFAVHDFVRVGEREGKVMRMTMRETILMTLEGNHLRIPNAMVFKEVIVNFTRNPLRRFDFVVGVGVEQNLAHAQRVGLSGLEAMSGVISEPPPFALIEELGDSSVLIRFFGWVHQPDHDILKVRSEAIRRVKCALDDAGVEMPEPIHRVRFEQRELPAARGLEEAEGVSIAADATIDRQIVQDLGTDPAANLLEKPRSDGGNAS